MPIAQVIEHLSTVSVHVEEGPVLRTGAVGKIESVYIRDPDKNLVEISNYIGAMSFDDKKKNSD